MFMYSRRARAVGTCGKKPRSILLFNRVENFYHNNEDIVHTSISQFKEVLKSIFQIDMISRAYIVLPSKMQVMFGNIVMFFAYKGVLIIDKLVFFNIDFFSSLYRSHLYRNAKSQFQLEQCRNLFCMTHQFSKYRTLSNTYHFMFAES